PGNKGFDAVGIRRTAAGEIQDIMIVESKFSADGAVKLARYGSDEVGRYSQMSDQWMRSVLDRMKKSTNQELIDLSKQIRINNTKVSRKLNVLSADGNTTWATDKLPKTEIYKP
ncbi:MAG: hypothetical protein CMM87_03715, partial [Rickettsiales bacterium]|nr:hypothetical protein [Rickettsiales bacterium]